MGAEINILLILLASTGVGIYLISTILIYEFHKKRNDKTPSFILINFMIFKYVNRYKQITRAETRRVGPLFYLWVISVNVALLGAILLFLVNVVVMREHNMSRDKKINYSVFMWIGLSFMGLGVIFMLAINTIVGIALLAVGTGNFVVGLSSKKKD